jgi:hypothetical protein
VLAGGYGSRGILAALRREGKFAAYPTRSRAGLGRGAGGRPDVLVLTQRRDPEELDADACAAVRRFVESGGRVLLTHDAVGFRYHPVLFEEIARGSGRALSSVVSPVAGTPLARTIGPEPVGHAHFDHVLITPGAGAEILATGGDEETGKGAVVVLGRLGEGRVLACGIAIGIDAEQLERAPAGREAEFLSALVGHLAAGDPGGNE